MGLFFQEGIRRLERQDFAQESLEWVRFGGYMPSVVGRKNRKQGVLRSVLCQGIGLVLQK
jgi:hypothetical protein